MKLDVRDVFYKRGKMYHHGIDEQGNLHVLCRDDKTGIMLEYAGTRLAGASSHSLIVVGLDDPTGDDVAADACRTTGGKNLETVIAELADAEQCGVEIVEAEEAAKERSPAKVIVDRLFAARDGIRDLIEHAPTGSAEHRELLRLLEANSRMLADAGRALDRERFRPIEELTRETCSHPCCAPGSPCCTPRVEDLICEVFDRARRRECHGSVHACVGSPCTTRALVEASR